MELDRRTLLKGAGAGAGALAVAGAGGATAATRVSSTVVGPTGATGVLQLARVWPTVKGALDAFDDTHHVFPDGSVEVLLWPGDLARLASTGMRFEVTVNDVVSRDRLRAASAPARPAALRTQPGERQAYRVLADYEADLRQLAADHPGRARVVALPVPSLEGRTVLGIEIAEAVDALDGRPTFYMDGVHHAREWPASEFTIMWAFDLLESAASGDAQVLSLLSRLRFFIVPVVNVDGFHYSRSSLIDTSVTASGNGAFAYWRKNRRSLTGEALVNPLVSDASSPDAYGIDNNRNYGYKWGGGGSSASLVSQTYRGPAPFSEPETQNVKWALSTRQATAMITNHTSGDLILWAWGDTRDDAPDDALLVELGHAMAAFNGYRPQKSIDLYVTTGTCSDYAYGTHGSLGYTFEHAGSSFHPDYASTIPRQYAENRPAFLLLAEAAADASKHAVISGRLVDAAGAPVSAPLTLLKDFASPLSAGNPTGQAETPERIEVQYASGEDGTFVLHVNPSTRPELEFQGASEAFTLAWPGGSEQVTVPRGGSVALGDLVVTEEVGVVTGEVSLVVGRPIAVGPPQLR